MIDCKSVDTKTLQNDAQCYSLLSNTTIHYRIVHVVAGARIIDGTLL